MDIISKRQSLKARFDQADKEAYISLSVYIGYIFWWALCAYGLGSQNPDTYTYIWGFPAWFFYACVVGYPLLTLVLWAVVAIFFKDMPLDSKDIPLDADDTETLTAHNVLISNQPDDALANETPSNEIPSGTPYKHN